jgi:hypothetical protein
MKKQILLVPENIIRRLRLNQISLDVLMSPDLVVKHLSQSEIIAIEVLNTRIDELLHPSVIDMSKNTLIHEKLDCKFTSYLARLQSVSMNSETKNIFEHTINPMVKNNMDLSILDEMRGPVRELRSNIATEPFTKHDTSLAFAVIGVTAGAFAVKDVDDVKLGTFLSTSMSLTEVFLELVLSVLHMYSTRSEVAVTDVYGKYVRLLVANTLGR